MPTREWTEYLRLARAGVPTTVAATVVLEQHRRARRLGRPSLPREHGTERGWRQHRTDRTPACPPCRAAHSTNNTRRAA